MRIILFGASGRLGTALECILSDHDYLTPSPREVDITDREAVRRFILTNPADLVVNAAAYNDVDGAESNVELAHAINAHAAGFVAEAASDALRPVVHFSTDYVFDGVKRHGYVEGDKPSPVSAYGWSKLLGERLVALKNPNHYLIRTSRLYGRPARDPKAKRSFVDIVLDLSTKQSAFTINGAEVSAPTLVDDLARHLDHHIFKPLYHSTTPPLPYGIYHLSNQDGCSWFEWAQAIAEIKNLPVTITPRDQSEQPRPAKRPDYSVLISTKLPSMRPWRDALQEFLTDGPINR